MSKKTAGPRILPHVLYAKEAEEAARFYTKVFPKSKVDRVTTMPAESPSGPPGSVSIVEFTLCGQALMAIRAEPHDSFNDAISLLVNRDTQAEIDRYCDAILKNGGKPQARGYSIPGTLSFGTWRNRSLNDDPAFPSTLG